MARPRRAALAASSVWLLVACGGGPPPYGFADIPEQGFRFEAEDLTIVDGAAVRVERYAECRVRAEPTEDGTTKLALYLERYYESASGEDRADEVAISAEGIVVRRKGEEVRLEAGDRTPTADSVKSLLERPIATAMIESHGEVVGSTRPSDDPLVSSVDFLEWLLLALPVLPGTGSAAWNGSREVPRIGQYRLGVQLPIRYERVAPEPGRESGAPEIRGSGFARRSSLKLAEGFSGQLELEFRGQAELDPAGRLKVSTLELELRFDATTGGEIASAHRVRLTCTDCGNTFNSRSQPPDKTVE